MMSQEELKKCLTFKRPFPDKQFESLLAKAQEVKFKAREIIIQKDDINENFYLIKKGLLRGFFNYKNKENTFYFASPGDLVTSPGCLFMEFPAVITLESFTDSVVLAMPKSEVMKMVSESSDFALWLIELCFGQLYTLERKATILCGDASERYDALIQTRPQLILQVPVKIIASYLGIAETSLSRVRNPKYQVQKKEEER